MDAEAIEDAIAEEAVACCFDPVAWSSFAWDWGQGDLARHSGPRTWQQDINGAIRDHLADPAKRYQPLRISVASGHGIGKSGEIGMLVNWAMSCWRNARVLVTANTDTQLRTKTWPEITKWAKLSITAHWWRTPAMSLYAADPDCEKSWRADATPWSEHNTEAFAGLHNEGRLILLIFDEASNIADKVWEVAEGALTDENTVIIWLAFGNPTRNTGRFRECFGKFRHLWVNRQIDSRTVEGTNRAYLDELVATHGEDSDVAKVRVRGVFPDASVLQFIARGRVDAAMARDPFTTSWKGRTAAVGVDVARFGDDQSVIYTRVGRDGSSIAPKRFGKLDTMQLTSRVIEHLGELRMLGLRFVLFVDGGGVGGGVIDRLRQLSHDVIEVQFGGKASDEKKYANRRAEMWDRMKEWLDIGSLPQLEDLAVDLTSVDYSFDKADRILLEKKEHMKARGLASPDIGDALALTFADTVPEWQDAEEIRSRTTNDPRGHDPFADI